MSPSGDLTPGSLVAGRYQIESCLGGEGSAAVHRAVDTRLDRAVALRVIATGAERGGEVQQGRAAARLVHPNIARVLDFGEDAEAGLHFVVADLGTGGTLAALLTQRGTPPLPLALRMVQETAAGLAAAHHAGLVHGDLHPGVVWLSRDEGRLRVQVLGLGLDPSGGVPPRASARYASPERLRRVEKLTPASDVFSLGSIAYEVLAGLPEDWTALLLAMARGKTVVAPSPAEARPELPPAVAQAVRRALLAEPEARWHDAGELAAQLFAERDAVPPAAATAVPAAPAAPTAPDPGAATAGRRTAPRRPPLSGTDLADTLYIPPAARKPDPEPSAAAQPGPTAGAADPPLETVPSAGPLPGAEAGPSLAVVPVAPVDEAVEVSATTAETDVSTLPVRRLRFGLPATRSRGLMAAGVVLAILLVGGVVARNVVAGPQVTGDAGRAAARALAANPVGPAAEPPAPLAGPEELPAAEEPAAADAVAAEDADEERRREAERQRLEEQRRLQQARQDSLRVAQQLAAQQLAAQQLAAQQQAQQVASTAPRSVEEPRSTPAPRIEPVVDAPAAAPVTRAADPNRTYGAGEVDQLPSLANRGQFQASVQRSYPSILRNTSTWGTAVVSFVVLPDGRVDRGSISVGEVSHPAFRNAAVAAVSGARFNPARVAGQPVRAQASISITWQPPDGE
jgi:TonB family protein